MMKTFLFVRRKCEEKVLEKRSQPPAGHAPFPLQTVYSNTDHYLTTNLSMNRIVKGFSIV